MGLSTNDLGGGRRGANQEVGEWRCGDRGSSGRRSRSRRPDGDLYLRRPSADRDVRSSSRGEEDRRLLAALDGEHTLEQLRAEFGAEAVDDTIAQMQELEVIEDAADDDLIDPAELRPLRPPAALLLRHRPRRPDAVGVPAAAARGEGRGARRRRARRLGRLVARHLRDRRDVADRRRPGRDLATSTARSSTPRPTSACSRSRWRRRGCAPSTRRRGSRRRRGGSESAGRDRRLHRRRRHRHRRRRLARLRHRALVQRAPASRPASPTSR